MTMKNNDEQLATLKQIAEKIGTAGEAEDDVLVELRKGIVDGLKGISDAFSGILELAKAKPPAKKSAPPEEEEGEEEGEEEEGGEEEEEDDDKAPGYQDMEMGTTGEFIDGTQFMLDAMQRMEKADVNVRELTKAVEALTKLTKALHAENASIRSAIAEGSLANANITIPLAKAVVDIREAMLQIPSASPTPRPRLPGGASLNAAAYLGGSKLSEQRALAKALSQSIIDSSHVAAFHTTRQFSTDAEAAKTLRARVEALATPAD